MSAVLNQEQIDSLTKTLGELSTQYKNIAAEQKEFGAARSETKEAVSKLNDAIAEMRTQLKETIPAQFADLLAKLNERRADAELPKSIGQQVIEDKNFLAAIKSGGRFSVSVACKGALFAKDITGVSLGLPQTLSQIGVAARLPFGVRTLVPSGRTSAGALEYLEETTFTNNAAIVAEGQPKPKSDKVYTPRTSPVRTIAHYFKVSRQTMDDLPFLMSQIENNGVYGVQLVEDNELLNGSGAPPHLQGFMTVATAAPAPADATANLVDAVGVAMFDLAAKGYLPDGSVLNPADWGSVALLKSIQGNYLYANPLDYVSNGRLWGTRLVLSANQAAGNFLVGAFNGNSQLLDREDVNVQIAFQNEDDFIKNMVTVLVEERIALVIYQPGAFEKGVTPPVTPLGVQSEGRSRKG